MIHVSFGGVKSKSKMYMFQVGETKQRSKKQTLPMVSIVPHRKNAQAASSFIATEVGFHVDLNIGRFVDLCIMEINHSCG